MSRRSFSSEAVARNFAGAAVMACFAAMALGRWHTTGLLFFLIIFIKNGFAAGFLAVRRKRRCRTESRMQVVIAYASTALPLLYVRPLAYVPAGAQLIASALIVAGYSLSTIALLELGQSFGIAPATRLPVGSGPYRFLRHPMYIGYVVAEFGMVIVNPMNFFFYLLSALLYHYRSRKEDSISRMNVEVSIRV